jgi:hypothetical protein
MGDERVTDPSTFLQTLEHLMRLTHDGKIAWEQAPPTHANGLRSYVGHYEDLVFELFEDPKAQTDVQPFEAFYRAEDPSRLRYVLRVRDTSDHAVLESPPTVEAAQVALAVKDRLEGQREKLHRINERLAQS